MALEAEAAVKRLRKRLSNIGSVDLFGDGERNAQAHQIRKLNLSSFAVIKNSLDLYYIPISFRADFSDLC